MSQRDGQVDDDINVVTRQQVIHAVGIQAMFVAEGLSPIDQDIGAGGQLDYIKRRAAADIGRRDIARSNDANIQCLHSISFLCN